MKRSGVSLLVAILLLAGIVPTASAETIWTARPSGHGAATIRVGNPDRLSIGLTSFRAGSTYTVALRRGSCASVGSLVLSVKLKASSTGRLTRTILMTATQTRAARIPLTLRVGSICASFTLPTTAVAAFGDGIYKVGTGGIAPGTYRAAGSASCYWARLLDLTVQEVLANRAGSGPSVVTILPTDGAFTSTGCGSWVLNAPAVPTASPGPGVWRVVVDVQPGTYRSSGGESCSWARLFGFQGNSQLESNVVSGPATVIIRSTDVGFESNRCGSWTRLS